MAKDEATLEDSILPKGCHHQPEGGEGSRGANDTTGLQSQAVPTVTVDRTKNQKLTNSV